MNKSLLPSLALILAVQLRGAAAFSAVAPQRARVRTLNFARGAWTDTTSCRTKCHPGVAPLLSTAYHTIGVGPLLSTANGEGDAADAGIDAKVEGRKKRVIMGYKAAALTYLGTGLLSINVVRMIPAYLVAPAAVSYILASAADHDRLNSDTYKRLNLALLEYGLVGLGLSILALRGNFKQQNAVMALAFALSAINAVKGYAYGVLGWDKNNSETTLLQDLGKGTKDTVKGFLSVPKSIKSGGYFALMWLVGSLKLMKLKEVVTFIQVNSFASGLALPLAQFNRLALLTLLLYTLKDAADRNRLGGTTFIQLNYLCGLAMGVNATRAGVTTPLGALSAFFAVFCGFNGVSSYFANQYA
ncbi:hypothetical protein ACHAXT_003066 [Thalassiosira profunda]